MRSRAERALLALTLFGMVSCGEDIVPRPRGYFRLDLPVLAYEHITSACAFQADVPRYAVLVRRQGDTLASADTVCWCNLWFPRQRATVHMTYRRVQGDLPELINDAHAFKDKHEAMAARIRAERVENDSARVFGTMFDVDGDVASPMVFYLTDSTKHFLYGSLYFDTRPNGDSLKPVTDRIRADLRRFANSLTWH